MLICVQETYQEYLSGSFNYIVQNLITKQNKRNKLLYYICIFLFSRSQVTQETAV